MDMGTGRYWIGIGIGMAANCIEFWRVKVTVTTGDGAEPLLFGLSQGPRIS